MQNFGGTRVRTTFSTTVFLWMAHDLPTVPLRHFVSNHHDPVNRALTEVLDEIDGLPLRLRTSSTRKIDGGPPFTTFVETEISGIELKDVAAEVFQVPSSFREQEPVYGFADSAMILRVARCRLLVTEAAQLSRYPLSNPQPATSNP